MNVRQLRIKLRRIIRRFHIGLVGILFSASLVVLIAFGLVKCFGGIAERNTTYEEERYKKYPSETESSFAHPEIVGTLEDGRVVKRVTVQERYKTHYIYFVGKDTTVNFNAGKTSPENVNTLFSP